MGNNGPRNPTKLYLEVLNLHVWIFAGAGYAERTARVWLLLCMPCARAWYLPHMCAKISATPEDPGNGVPVIGNGKRVLEGKETSGRSCLDVTVIVAEVVMWEVVPGNDVNRRFESMEYNHFGFSKQPSFLLKSLIHVVHTDILYRNLPARQ
jgi:hypothetical protein